MRYVWMCLFLFGLTINLSAQWQSAGEPVKVAGSAAEEFTNPVWSPTDGQLIALTKPDYRGIWLLDLADGSIRQISDETGAGFGFSWSHNGAAIVTRVAKYEGRIPFNEILVYDVATGDYRNLTTTKTRFRDVPRWSSDDALVYAFAKKDVVQYETGFVAAKDSVKKSNALVYNKNGKIAIKNNSENGEAIAKVYDPAKGARYINIAVSPDGQKIAFEVMGGNLHTMNVDGSELVDLGEGYRPAWSPDGKYLAYMITEDDGHRFTASDIYIVPATGGTAVNITKSNDRIELNPSWSPEGDQIAFDDYNAGEVYILAIQPAAVQEEN